MARAAPNSLNCPNGTHITGIRTKNDYDQWIVGIQLQCSDGSTVSHMNPGSGSASNIGVVTRASSNNRELTPHYIAIPHGFDALARQTVSYFLFNVEAYLKGLSQAKTNNDPKSWSPTSATIKCPEGQLAYGISGRLCEANDPLTYTGVCNMIRIDDLNCLTPSAEPINGDWSDWSEWDMCVGPCGKKTRKRHRTCTSPSPSLNGADCIGVSVEQKDCGPEVCPVDGKWSEWGEWSGCTKLCGEEEQLRKRLCNSPSPEHGGADCVGPASSRKSCDHVNCPLINLLQPIEQEINGGLMGQGWTEIKDTEVAVSDQANGVTPTKLNKTPLIVGGEKVEVDENGDPIKPARPSNRTMMLILFFILVIVCGVVFNKWSKNNTREGGAASGRFWGSPDH